VASDAPIAKVGWWFMVRCSWIHGITSISRSRWLIQTGQHSEIFDIRRSISRDSMKICFIWSRLGILFVNRSYTVGYYSVLFGSSSISIHSSRLSNKLSPWWICAWPVKQNLHNFETFQYLNISNSNLAHRCSFSSIWRAKNW
jgi:hypothetical protein